MHRKSKVDSLPRNLFNLLAVIGIFIFVTACVCRSGREAEQPESKRETQKRDVVQEQPEAAPERNEPETRTGGEKKNDEGDFVVEHIAVQNERYTGIDRQIKENKILEKAANDLNQSLILPYDIALRSKDCSEVNAFYDPNDRSITVCYELMEHFFVLFKKAGNEDQQAYNKMFEAVHFVFLHELGHALIDAYKLPIAGNEEDAADRCSSYVCLEELGESGVRAILAAAEAFALESKLSAPNERAYADEHLLREQRFYNSLCMIYGSNTSKYDYILSEGLLPKERAVRCPSEYERTAQAWGELLGPWRK